MRRRLPLRALSANLGIVIVLTGVVVPRVRADGEHEVIFRAASGSIVCDGWSLGASFTDNQVMCALLWTRLTGAYPCANENVGCPDIFTLKARGSVDISRAHWEIGASRTLKSGEALTYGHLRCVVKGASVTCSSKASGHGFLVSRAGVRTW